MTDIDDALRDVVLFELPTGEDADAFADRFARWPVWMHADGAVWCVAVDLTDAPDDLPGLLRGVQALVAELGLQTIVLHLDGRGYLLEAANAAAVTAPLR